MRQVLLPIKLRSGVVDGGFLIGAAVEFDGVFGLTLESGNLVSIEHMPGRTTNAEYAVAVLPEDKEASREYITWPEYIGNKLLTKDSKLWLGGSAANLELRVWDTSLLQELLAGRVYTAAIHPPANTGDGTNVEDDPMTTYPYGSNNYWTSGDLVPPELASNTDPELTTADLSNFDYVHSQLSASATWVVQHNLGRKPVVSIVDPDGNLLVAAIEHVSNDVLHAVFQSDKTGTARCV